MTKSVSALKALVFCTFIGLGVFTMSCDFGNKTNDTAQEGAEDGTIQKGDNADDNAQPDTAEVGSFQK